MNQLISALFFTILIGLVVSAGAVYGQNEIERERSSLRGITEVGFTANMEVTRSLEGDIPDVTGIEEEAESRLDEYGLNIISDNEVRSSAEIPFVYMHINTMDAGEGLVPFSISIRFYQPVELLLHDGVQSSASTWETGTVGIVSHDRLPMIRDAAINLLQDFINDHRTMNR